MQSAPSPTDAAPPGTPPEDPSRWRRFVAGLAAAGSELRRWPARRVLVAAAAAAFTVLFIAIPTDLIDTPLFAREVPPTAWSWPALLVSAALAGLVTATYVAHPDGAAPRPSESRLGMAGFLVTFFAVGCPVCNKLVLLALGTTGAMQFFEPVQPYLAAASIALLAWALFARLARESACRLPVRTAPAADTGPRAVDSVR